MKRLFQKLVGWWRLRRGYCPACNSDAPEIDRCSLCCGGRLQLFYYPPQHPLIYDDWDRIKRNREITWNIFCRHGFCLLIICGLFGCTPHVHRIDVRSTYDEWPKCERCGEPATENVSEVADEQNWRCDRCNPRNVMPRLQRKPKLERQWVMR